MDNKASNTLISKSVQKRLSVQNEEIMKEVDQPLVSDYIQTIDDLRHIIESNRRRHEEDMGYIQHYRIRITELEKALKENNIEVP
jgi:molecular chaperone GrpE (heat shock protein)